jgi:tetratricopeptide (TPR) repeat protein/predicted aspartyl protease
MGGKLVRFASILFASLAAATPSLAAAPGCQLGKVAELHVTMEGLWPIVTVKVNGRPARFVVDSGAFYSMVTPRAAEKLGMSSKELPSGYVIQGAVGATSARLGTAAKFGFDQLSFDNVQFLIAGDSLGDADGLLGQNVLGSFDVDYDLANGVVRMFRAQGCDKAMLAYWATGGAGVSMMPIARTTPIEPHIYGRAIVNDLPIRVTFDTGAGRSMLKLSAALRAGANLQAEEASADEAMHGIGRRATDSYIVPFSSFEMGDETIKNIRLRVAKSDFTGADMLLGGDFFLSHRVLVSTSQHKLYFTYNGGPVFRLDDDGVRSNPFAPVALAPDPKAAKPGAPEALDASALQRRAAAAAARHDFPRAIADLDQAIGLEPENAELYYDRARWKFAGKPPGGGLRDLETALKLKPDLAKALVLRGHLRLAAGEADKADADFAAALKTDPDQPDLELQIADAYSQTRQYERAIARYDAWLAKYPKSFDVGEALNGRCWTRALWGRQLDQALADCNLALKRGSRLADVLDSRGMVRLRRGEFAQAIADYDAALKLQPKLAPSLYARGLAKQKAGDAAGAAADLQAASAVEPQIAEQMKALGISEATVVIAALP